MGKKSFGLKLNYKVTPNKTLGQLLRRTPSGKKVVKSIEERQAEYLREIKEINFNSKINSLIEEPNQNTNTSIPNRKITCVNNLSASFTQIGGINISLGSDNNSFSFGPSVRTIKFVV